MTSKLIKQAEAEFDEPFADILRGFAEMGYSVAETARTLGYSEGRAITQWMRRNGVNITFVHGHKTESYRDAMKRRDFSRLNTAAATRAGTKHYCTYDGIYAPVADHCRRLGLDHRTVYHRMRKTPEGPPSVWFRPPWSGVGRNRTHYGPGHPWAYSEERINQQGGE